VSRDRDPHPLLDPAEVVVRYDWPVGGEHPFDLTSDETRWVLYAGAWGRAWRPGTWGDFGDWTSEFPVPMGYKQLLAIERLAVLSLGRVVREWSETGLSSYDGREHAYVACAARGGLGPIRVPWEEAMDKGLVLSEAVGLVMVGRLRADVGWH
jgi:hypothetical protein